MIRLLEQRQLNSNEKQVVNLIRSQLEPNWRLHLIKCLDKLIKEYK